MTPTPFATGLTAERRAALHTEALRRAAELRRESIVRAWDALFGVFARMAGRRPPALASRGDAAN